MRSAPSLAGWAEDICDYVPWCAMVCHGMAMARMNIWHMAVHSQPSQRFLHGSHCLPPPPCPVRSCAHRPPCIRTPPACTPSMYASGPAAARCLACCMVFRWTGAPGRARVRMGMRRAAATSAGGAAAYAAPCGRVHQAHPHAGTTGGAPHAGARGGVRALHRRMRRVSGRSSAAGACMHASAGHAHLVLKDVVIHVHTAQLPTPDGASAHTCMSMYRPRRQWC